MCAEVLRPNMLVRVGDNFTSIVERVEDDTIVVKVRFMLPPASEGWSRQTE